MKMEIWVHLFGSASVPAERDRHETGVYKSINRGRSETICAELRLLARFVMTFCERFQLPLNLEDCFRKKYHQTLFAVLTRQTHRAMRHIHKIKKKFPELLGNPYLFAVKGLHQHHVRSHKAFEFVTKQLNLQKSLRGSCENWRRRMHSLKKTLVGVNCKHFLAKTLIVELRVPLIALFLLTGYRAFLVTISLHIPRCMRSICVRQVLNSSRFLKCWNISRIVRTRPHWN